LLAIDVGVGSEEHQKSSQVECNFSASLPLVKLKGLCSIVLEYDTIV